MTRLLLKLFIKTNAEKEPLRYRAKVGSMAGLVGIACNVILFFVKLFVGFVTGAVSVTADAMNNLTDASGSIVTLIGFHVAGKPADDDHPFGHARAEYLSGLIVSGLILLIGFELVKTSFDKILHPSAVTLSWATAIALAASILVKLWMSVFNRKLGKDLDSASLIAVSQDSRNDCIATFAVLAAALIETFFSVPVDGYVGMLVAVFILYSGINLAKETVSPLLGEKTDPELKKKIADFILSKPTVLGIHDLMVHDYGPGHRFGSLHVEMDYREDAMDCHERIDQMERELLKAFGVNVVIHYDPIVTDDPALNGLKEASVKTLSAIDPRLSLHDFRAVPGKKHMNVLFDVVLPHDLSGREAFIRESVEKELNNGEEVLVYHVVITFDAQY